MCPAPLSETTLHMGCRPGDLAPVVILTSHADLALKLSKQISSVKTIADRREYLTLTGMYNGQPVSICSAGLGSPPVAIAVEEIYKVGGKTLLWLGELEPLEPADSTAELPELVIVWAAIRGEYTTRQYVPLAYPALSDPGVAAALEQAALESGKKAQMGVVLTADLPAARAAFTPSSQELQAYRQAGVLGREMSVSALLVTAVLLDMRAGALLWFAGKGAVKDQMLMQICLNALARLKKGDI